MRKTTYSIIAEVHAKDLFGDDNINWLYCKEHATFVHNDSDACEFILEIGNAEEAHTYAETTIKEMAAYGCTSAFIDAYTEARDAGALRVLFHK